MTNLLKVIHYFNYLQYPFLLLGMGFSLKRYFIENSDKWEDINTSMVFFGIALSFAGLADIKRIGGMSKKILSNPRNGKLFIIYLSFLSLLIIGIGIYGSIQESNLDLKRKSTGLMILGIGIISLLKMSIELYKSSMENN